MTHVPAAYRAFLPKPKEPKAWSVQDTWRFVILACGTFWVGVAVGLAVLL